MPVTQAVFKRLLTRNKSKSPKSKQPPETSVAERLLEFERLKLRWKDELAAMSEFLVIESTEEQRAAGAAELVDTAYVVDRDGLPTLRAVFGVQRFKPIEVTVCAEDAQLTVRAESTGDTDCATFRRALVRRLDLPLNVDRRRMHCAYSPSGALAVEMPFHLLPRRCPAPSLSPSHPAAIVPILLDAQGRRVIRLACPIGPDFTSDDLAVSVAAGLLTVHAAYSAELGAHGAEVTRREVRRQFRLPPGADVESFRQGLSPDGCVHVELVLRPHQEFHCHVTTEDVQLIPPPDSSPVRAPRSSSSAGGEGEYEEGEEEGEHQGRREEWEGRRCSTDSDRMFEPR